MTDAGIPEAPVEPVNVGRYAVLRAAYETAYQQLRDRLDDLDLLADFDGRTVFDAIVGALDEGRAAFLRLPRPEDLR